MTTKMKVLCNRLDNETLEVFVYGTIGRWMSVDTNYLIRELDSAIKAGTRNIIFYVNSGGGEVPQGQALWNYLDRNDLVNVTWVVDGIAASMAAMLLTNTKHTVKMSKYAKLMYHRVSGMVEGNSEEVRAMADTMDLFEGDLIKMLASRTGMDEKKVKKEFFGAVDRWIGAEEALKLQLIDQVIDGKIVEEPTNLTDANEVYYHYDKQLTALRNTLNPNIDRMKQLTNLLKLDEKSDEAAIAAAISQILESNSTLANKLAEKDGTIATLQAKVDEAHKAKVDALVAEAKAKKVTPELEAVIRETAATNFAAAKTIVDNMPSVERVIDNLKKDETETNKDWTWDNFHKAGKLDALKRDNIERFKSLYKAKYNKEYKE
jgi:ATP-dependent protease ClpP protease subunit